MIYNLFNFYTLFFSTFIENEIMSCTFLILFCMFTVMLVWRIVRGNF